MAKLEAKNLNPVCFRLRAAIEGGAVLLYDDLHAAYVHGKLISVVEKATGTDPFTYLDEEQRDELVRLTSYVSDHTDMNHIPGLRQADHRDNVGLQVLLAYCESVRTALERQRG